MPQDLTTIVQSFAGRRILLVGDLIFDRYLYGDAERISPEAPVPVLRVVESREAVGGSANVATCLRALGCEVDCCGIVGRDGTGDRLRGLLEEAGVQTSGLMAIDDRRTTTKTRLVGLAQHRHRQQLLRLDEEDSGPLDTADGEKFIQIVCERIAKADVICIEDYDKGVVSTVLVKRIVDTARKYQRPVLVDPARISDYSRYRGVDVLTPNREELSIASGKTFSSLEDIAGSATNLAHALELTAVVATVDRDGAVLVRRNAEWKHIPTVPRTVYDNTGAGDAVLAMLAAAVAAGADMEKATRLANIAGGLEVEKFGCVPITVEEILAELRLGERRRSGVVRTADELAAELTLRRDRGETVAFTNGCFDILHAGHVGLLQRAREEATLLVVGLNSDASVRAQGKGADRPVNTFADRAAVIGALQCVDYVVGFDEATPENLIRRIRPDVLVKGEDWAERGVIGREFVESTGGRVVLLPLLEGRSTTQILERIRSGAYPLDPMG
jgi:D-beta-D-heptose 7-phosphate kinase/D-beta-D-heptose 1-phosphate adenosyltransferase